MSLESSPCSESDDAVKKPTVSAEGIVKVALGIRSFSGREAGSCGLGSIGGLDGDGFCDFGGFHFVDRMHKRLKFLCFFQRSVAFATAICKLTRRMARRM